MRRFVYGHIAGIIALCAIGLLAHPSVRAKDVAGAKGDKFTEAVSGELQKKVDEAIALGVKLVQSQQYPDGSWDRYEIGGFGYEVGHTALCTYALLQCDVNPFDKKIEQAFDWMRGKELKRTYEVALIILCITAKWEHIEAADTGNTKAKGKRPCDKMSDEDRKWLERCFSFLVEKRLPGEGWRYPEEESCDISNTQYGMLGLAAAARCGLTAQPKVWQELLDYFLSAQEPKGPEAANRLYSEKKKKDQGTQAHLQEKAQARGWGYSKGPGPVYGSMTAAGIACVALARDQLILQQAINKTSYDKAAASIRDGIAWLGENFSMEKNPKCDGWHYYYIYGLERAGVLSDRVYMKDHNWYKEGAEFLVGQQRADGAWNGGATLQDTCFALLFLKMASKHLSVATTGGK